MTDQISAVIGSISTSAQREMTPETMALVSGATEAMEKLAGEIRNLASQGANQDPIILVINVELKKVPEEKRMACKIALLQTLQKFQ